MPKKSRQKLKYLQKEKSFYGEIKTIHHFGRAIIEANKKSFFFEGESPNISHSSWRLKYFLSLVLSLSVRLFQNGSCWGFTDFLVLILSQALIAPALIRFLKPIISFKVTLEIALVIHYLVSQPPRLLCQILLFHIRHCPQELLNLSFQTFYLNFRQLPVFKILLTWSAKCCLCSSNSPYSF